MRRRDLLKGAAILPIMNATALYAKLCGVGNCQPGMSPLRVVFDGPFSVVLQAVSASSDSINGVVAFTPVEPNQKHLFNLNGVPLTAAQHNFKLNISGYTPASKPCIDPKLAGFCTDHTKWDSSPGKRFVTIVLPCPNRIVTSRAPISVMVGGKQLDMPQNYVLEYDIQAQNKATMDYLGRSASPVANTFIFEVGMDPQIDPDANCSHAMEFYNKSTLPFFPDLTGNTIQKFNTCPSFKGHPYSLTARQQKREDENRVTILTTTLECKSGGLIVSTP